MHRTNQWEGMNTEISCLMSTRKSVLSIVGERMENRVLQKELSEQRKAKEEEGNYVRKLEGLLDKFGDEVKRVGELEKEILAPKVGESGVITPKLMKPLDLPLFSGIEPVPKDEGSFDQWMFQVQGVLDSHSKEAVRSSIIHSVRGEVRELMRFI